MDDGDDDEDTLPLDEFQAAAFPADLRLPTADAQKATDAAIAIRHEYRACSQWKRLRCRKVSVFAERDRGDVYIVHVGSSVEFDWTWEGAVAFRPRSLDDESLPPSLLETTAFEDEVLWKGEVIEVDERNGYLFISLDDPEAIPIVGSFFVRPFEFLSVLDAVCNSREFEQLRVDLADRLAATQGGIHPVVKHSSDAGLPNLVAWWQHSWCVLWGPPGTGKTWTTGQQVAAVLADPTERILVVSTTNRATDSVAMSIGNAARGRSVSELSDGRILRIGKGAAIRAFAASDLEPMLMGTESELLHEMDDLAGKLRLADTWEEKSLLRKKMGELRAGGGDQSKRNFIDSNVRVVIATAFKATSFLKDSFVHQKLDEGDAPFTTVFIDEAGLMSRTSVAALSFLAARRVVLVGDPKQLAPISRISRVLPTRQQNWQASSGLEHLDVLNDTPSAVHVLSEQYRMHPDVCQVVSEYQYGGGLTTARETLQRPENLVPALSGFSRAIWYVLDEEGSDLATIRADRGPGNKSWVRSITTDVLDRLFLDSEMRQSNGLFISPFKAQAQSVAKWLTAWRLSNWEASTVHSQQGSEADIVIFDTVNAGNYMWPFEEWKRLINVALSRAREAVIVLASRNEMEEPYLKPMVTHLTPSRLIVDGNRCRWEKVSLAPTFLQQRGTIEVSESKPAYEIKPNIFGAMGEQISHRKKMTPVLSHEQQRLSNLKLDGKPRLVRGVAGSGKSLVLCNWLAKTVMRHKDDKHARIWAVYANRSLHRLLRESVESSWDSLWKDELFEKPEFPLDKVTLLHVKDVLAGMLPSVALSMDTFEFDYDRAAEEFLNRQDAGGLLPRCSALFIDEAQDMGPSTLKLLLSVVEQTDAEDPNSRSAHIFYDNAQNIYARKTPKWSEFGLDMRGRSTIMRESFRSTRPIAELAVNVLHRLTPADERQDQNELLGLGLIEKSHRCGDDWLNVRFNQIDGPTPFIRAFNNRNAEIDSIANHLQRLIDKEGISPTDICVIYNGKPVLQLLESRLRPQLKLIGVELSVQTNRPFDRQENTLIATTSHSYKGYESEVVVIPCADQFVTANGLVLSNNLYVAMTRARTLLAIYGMTNGSIASRQIMRTISKCIETMSKTPVVELSTSTQDDLHDILEKIGVEHRKWLIDLWNRFSIRQEPIMDANGDVLAEPIFWFEHSGNRIACFHDDTDVGGFLHRSHQSGIVALPVGQPVK